MQSISTLSTLQMMSSACNMAKIEVPIWRINTISRDKTMLIIIFYAFGDMQSQCMAFWRGWLY